MAGAPWAILFVSPVSLPPPRICCPPSWSSRYQVSLTCRLLQQLSGGVGLYQVLPSSRRNIASISQDTTHQRAILAVDCSSLDACHSSFELCFECGGLAQPSTKRNSCEKQHIVSRQLEQSNCRVSAFDIPDSPQTRVWMCLGTAFEHTPIPTGTSEAKHTKTG